MAATHRYAIGCVFGALLLAAAALFVMRVARNKYAPARYDGMDLVQEYVTKATSLYPLWMEADIPGKGGKVLAASAMAGSMQWGARFHVLVQYNDQEYAAVTNKLRSFPSARYVLKDVGMGLNVEGTKYEIMPRAGDGPYCLALIAASGDKRVYYYGYGGDGG